MVVTVLLIFLIAFIVFNIWNAVNLRNLLQRPLKNDSLNDKQYWELKYKMQYMITVFAVIVAILTFLGYNSISKIRDDIKSELASQLDSTRHEIGNLESRQKAVDVKIANTDSILYNAESAILGLTDREKLLKGSLSLRGSDLEKLKSRIQEINEKNIIQQNVYIVDNLQYTYSKYWDYMKYYFKDLKSNTGQTLPEFKKPPFILPVSNEGSTFSVRNVTAESFELMVTMTTNDTSTHLLTLFITQNP